MQMRGPYPVQQGARLLVIPVRNYHGAPKDCYNRKDIIETLVYPYDNYESRALVGARIQEKVGQSKARLSVLQENRAFISCILISYGPYHGIR